MAANAPATFSFTIPIPSLASTLVYILYSGRPLLSYATSTLSFAPPLMCLFEVFGDWYRGCSHFVPSYYSGEIEDCAEPYCRTSSAHNHKAPNCRCTAVETDKRRIVNMFHQPCETCRSEEFARRVGTKGVDR